MEHLYKLLARKKGLDIPDLLENGICTISLKIDGNAFQIGCDDGETVKYYKRSGSPEKVSPAKELTMYDCCFNEFYGDAILYFKKKEDILKDYTIINCEIIDKQHIIEYDENDDKQIYLLSAIQDGDFIGKRDLEILADDLGITRCPVILNNKKLPSEIVKIIKKHIPAAKEFEGSVKGLSENDLYEEITELLGDEIEWENQEGIVFTWNYGDKTVSAKLDNPLFIDKWFDMKESEESELRTDFTEVSRVFIDIAEKHIKEFVSIRGDDYLENMLLLFDTFTQKDIKDLYDSYEVDTVVDPASSKFVTLVCPELKDKLDNEVYRSVLNVIFIIMYKPKKRKTDLMDWDVQERINELIEFLH